jgi:hypothetical protein
MTALRASAIVLVFVSAVMPLPAHHSWPVNNDRLVTVTGKVIEFMWANPHPMIILEVQASDGRVEKWQVGGPAIIRMEANGWTKTTVKTGDVITGVGHQFADGEKVVKLDHVVLPDGKEMRVYGP